MSAFKCPVCGHTISDYLNEDVTCPNCNSDLSVYKALNTIANGEATSVSKNRVHKVLSIALPILVALLVGGAAIVIHKNTIKGLNNQLEASNNTVLQLRDSLSILSTTAPVIVEDAPAFFEYIIMPNDSPWGIVHKFYGNRENWQLMAQKIAEDNGIWNESTQSWNPIHPGDVLKLYNIK